jgi:hypothetical protein
VNIDLLARVHAVNIWHLRVYLAEKSERGITVDRNLRKRITRPDSIGVRATAGDWHKSDNLVGWRIVLNLNHLGLRCGRGNLWRWGRCSLGHIGCQINARHRVDCIQQEDHKNSTKIKKVLISPPASPVQFKGAALFTPLIQHHRVHLPKNKGLSTMRQNYSFRLAVTLFSALPF